MNKILIVLIVIAISILIGTIIFITLPKNVRPNLSLNLPEIKKDIKPSETFIDYTDPSGFSFSYPDNLSITNLKAKSEEDSDDYAQLQLSSKDINGSLNLRIVDSPYKSLDEWLKGSKISSSSATIEKKLGNLKALEVKTNDRLMLASLDQGVLFTIESPLIEQDFWSKVYDKVLKDFTFISPSSDNTGGESSSSDEVTFEGEEVIE